MALFSERYGYIVKPLQLESVSNELRNRVWNSFLNFVNDDRRNNNSNFLEAVMDACGLAVFNNTSKRDQNTLFTNLYDWIEKAEWYKIYDFIEIFFYFLSDEDKAIEKHDFNALLNAENAGYRVIGDRIVPITNEYEMSCIEMAEQTPYSNVNLHIQKASELLSRRPLPDYENSIKESISAVEALCCIITGQSGANATLGKTIKKLKDNGIHIHPAMENAFSSLYGYTSDENGIRHGGIDFSNAPAEDAKYMLVSCSAFVNYLIEKWSKASPTEKEHLDRTFIR